MKLLKHQEDALAEMQGRDFYGVWYDPGLGKTIIMLEHLKREGVFPALIVAPLNAVPVWGEEVEKHGYPFKVQELCGTKNQRLQKLEQSADLYVINYDGMRIIAPFLARKGFQTFIADEAHKLSRPSQQTRAATMIRDKAKKCWTLTGTPIGNNPDGIWYISNLMRPCSLGSYYAFKNEHVETRKFMVTHKAGKKEIEKMVCLKNFEDRIAFGSMREGLNSKIKKIAIRRTKAECLDLPPKVYKRVYCEMEGDQAKAYWDIKNRIVTALADKDVQLSSLASMTEKLRQISQGFVYGDDASRTVHRFESNAKVSALKELAEELANEKLFVLTHHIADIPAAKAALESVGRTVLVYEGDSATRHEFQKSDKPLVFLSNIERTKEGVTLTSCCHVVFFGQTYSYISRVQVEDRCHRITQERTVFYWDIVCRGGIDEKIQFLINKRASMADSVLGDTRRLAMLAIGRETYE